MQRLSGGRFTLGLGSQVKGHIERRFGMSWSAPGPWLREYVQALRAIWDCWQNGTKLDFRGEHYKLNLMVPLFTPAPIEHPQIPVELAAVNPYMCQVAGEVADGIRAHPIATPRYIAETMLPAVQRGAAKTGRDLRVYDVRDAAGRDRRPTVPRWPSGSPISARGSRSTPRPLPISSRSRARATARSRATCNFCRGRSAGTRWRRLSMTGCSTPTR